MNRGGSSNSRRRAHFPGYGAVVPFTLGMALTCILGACSAPALPPDYGKAEQLEREGRFEEALAVYEGAANSCKKRPADCAVTRMRVAQMQIRMGRTRQAVDTLIRLEQREGRGLREGARAMGRAADLLAKLGHWDRAMALWWHLVDHYPETLAADDALARIVSRYKAQKRLWDLVPLLRQRYLRLRRQDIGDNLLFEAGRILEKGTTEDKNLAVELYVQITLDYPEGGLRDNAWMAAADIRRKQGRFSDAISLYQKLLATREDAFGGASYHSEFLDDAHLAIGKIWLLDLHNPARAVAAFRELVNGLPTSVLRDDAQFWIVLAELERGREEVARQEFAVLERKFPRSKFRREAAALAQWIVLRRVARAKEDAQACQAWNALSAAHPFSWLVRKGPRPTPWPARCTPGARPAAQAAFPPREVAP